MTVLPLLFVECERLEATDSRPDLSGFCNACKNVQICKITVCIYNLGIFIPALSK